MIRNIILLIIRTIILISLNIVCVGNFYFQMIRSLIVFAAFAILFTVTLGAPEALWRRWGGSNGGFYPGNGGNGGYFPGGNGGNGGYFPGGNGGYNPGGNGGYYPGNNGGYYPGSSMPQIELL